MYFELVKNCIKTGKMVHSNFISKAIFPGKVISEQSLVILCEFEFSRVCKFFSYFRTFLNQLGTYFKNKPAVEK
jgi:hypothetical protein